MNIIVLMLLGFVLMVGLGRALAQSVPPAPTPAAPAPSATKPLSAAKPPPAAKPASPASATKPAGKPAKLEHIQKAQAEGIMGETVVDGKGQDIGQIVDVLINAQGTPHAAVVQFAGFLGVGNRNIAVEWKALDFKVVKNQIVISLDLDTAKLKSMPTYKTDAKSVPVAAPAKPVPVNKSPAESSPAKSSPAETLPAPLAPAPPAPAPSSAKPNAGQSSTGQSSAAKPGSSHQGAASPSGAQ